MVDYETLRWEGDAASGLLRLTDQTLLPERYEEISCCTVPQLFEAIRSLRVRGAPAIGVSAAYGAVLGTQDARGLGRTEFLRVLGLVCNELGRSRPTAVNLFYALQRMLEFAASCESETVPELHNRLLEEARRIELEDREMCLAIGRHGSSLVRTGMSLLTHCNAGGLATAGDGTALAVMFAASREGKQLHVFADETRPLLQGARLTAWELQQRGIAVTLICDNMAAQVMREGRVDMVITGADRIAANGDAANKIGTYGLAVLAAYHGIPFAVAAPSSTFDLQLSSGAGIPIEQRGESEVTEGFGRRTAPVGIGVYNPAFDVTPAELITYLITERGVIERPDQAKIADHLTHGLRGIRQT
ncbi:MAG: Methylthioribose-phosphate isomerase [Planctomycetota bacterium]|jgi:methylthioribose-1-phosphate isomerase